MSECVTRKLFGVIPRTKHKWQTLGYEYSEQENGLDLEYVQKCEFCGRERRISYIYSYGTSRFDNNYVVIDVCSFDGRLAAKERMFEMLQETRKHFTLKCEEPHIEFENYYGSGHYYGTKCLAIAEVRTAELHRGGSGQKP